MQTNTIEPAEMPQVVSRADVVRGLYTAMQSGNVAGVASLLDDDVVFHVPGIGPNAGDYRGKAEVLGFLGRAAEKTAGTLRLELSDVADGRDHAIALAHYTASRAGKTLLNRLCHVVRIQNARVVESWFYSRDQYAVDEFWND